MQETTKVCIKQTAKRSIINKQNEKRSWKNDTFFSFPSIITLVSTRSFPIQPHRLHSHQIRHDSVFKPPQTLPSSSIARFKASALLADVVNSTRDSAVQPPRFVRAGLAAVIAEHLAAASAVALRRNERKALLAPHTALCKLIGQEKAQLMAILARTQLLHPVSVSSMKSNESMNR